MTLPAAAQDAVTPPSDPPLSLSHVAITHDGSDSPTPADVSFDVRPGEVVLLLGPSGSGKSTLTLALNGLIPQAVTAEVSGRIRVGELDATVEPVARLSTRVAMVFQDPDAQLVTGTVLDEVAFGPENLRMPVDDVLARTEDALRRVGLWERRHDSPDLLSGGGRQRVAIACALAMGSPLLVLDEPTANLDPAGIEEVYAALRDLVADGDRAIVLVEHNLDAAIGLVDRVVVLDGAGRVVADGPVESTLRDRAAELHELGVWLPTATLAALRLRDAGYALDPLPLTPGQLRTALQALPAHTEAEGVAQRPDDAPTAEAPPPAGAPPLISVRGLTVRRGRTPVLHNVDLDVGAGEFLAVIGANGAGKTTLVQAIAGVVPPPKGSVRVAGIDPGRADVATVASHVGFVFQNPEHQFIAHTVADELAHGLRRQRLDEAQVSQRVAEILDRFGLTGREQTHPFLLSGGQKRRLSVGTALVAGAPVLALDEPTFGQDRARADELLQLLDDLHREGTTVIVVSHDMQLVAEHATHVAVLRDGRLLTHGPTAEILGDAELLAAAGLRPPPLAAAFADLTVRPELDGIVRLADLPAPRDVAAPGDPAHSAGAGPAADGDLA